MKDKIEFPTQMDLEEKISAWAHDLRSPFNHMIGFTKLILNGQSGPLTDMQREDLTTIFNSSLRAMSLMNNLIEIARLHRGEKDTNREALDPQAFIDQCLQNWKKFNPDKCIPIATHIDSISPLVMLDKGQTQWILYGFLSYLVAHSDDTGHITLEIADSPEALLFTFRQEDIQKQGHDQITMDMCAYISNAYIGLQGGKIQKSEIDDAKAVIVFSLPKQSKG